MIFHISNWNSFLAVWPTFALNSILRQRYLAYKATMWPYRSCNFPWEEKKVHSRNFNHIQQITLLTLLHECDICSFHHCCLPRDYPYLWRWDSVGKNLEQPAQQRKLKLKHQMEKIDIFLFFLIKQVEVQTYISVSPTQHFVQQVAELPADQGVAGQRQVQGVGPEGGRAALLVGSHDDSCPAVKETRQQPTNWPVVALFGFSPGRNKVGSLFPAYIFRCLRGTFLHN